jgi:6-pyruvoyltetrahydropterin/6-carboxytetrahydropterin synthase
MFSVGVSDHVMIAHSFADPFFGPAQRLHGATYAIDLEVRAPSLGVHHVVMDIGALRDLLRSILSELDYRNLDEHAAFAGRLSTTERVAQHVADRAASRISALAADAAPVADASVRVIVRESPIAYAAYERRV